MNVAARLQALAEPGGIYISRAAADQVRDKVLNRIERRGEQTVKNIARPIEVFCVIADERDEAVLALRDPETRARKTIVADKPTIAVLPFVNMSGEPEQEFFADGITEDVLTDLSRFRELFVISRNSAFSTAALLRRLRHATRQGCGRRKAALFRILLNQIRS